MKGICDTALPLYRTDFLTPCCTAPAAWPHTVLPSTSSGEAGKAGLGMAVACIGRVEPGGTLLPTWLLAKALGLAMPDEAGEEPDGVLLVLPTWVPAKALGAAVPGEHAGGSALAGSGARRTGRAAASSPAAPSSTALRFRPAAWGRAAGGDRCSATNPDVPRSRQSDAPGRMPAGGANGRDCRASGAILQGAGAGVSRRGARMATGACGRALPVVRRAKPSLRRRRSRVVGGPARPAVLPPPPPNRKRTGALSNTCARGGPAWACKLCQVFMQNQVCAGRHCSQIIKRMPRVG